MVLNEPKLTWAPQKSRKISKLPKKTLPLEEWTIVWSFLISQGVDLSALTAGVYLMLYKLDGRLYLKIGVADTLMTVKTPFSTKKGRILTSLQELRREFPDAELVKILAFLQEDTGRNLFKLDIEAFLLRQTKEYRVNPSSCINYTEIRNLKGRKKIEFFFGWVSRENGLNLIC